MGNRQVTTYKFTLLFILVCLILIIQIAIILYKPLTSYIRKENIKSHASIANLVDFCNTDEEKRQCIKDMEKYEYLRKPFLDLIESKDDIDCSDFSSFDEAWNFYHFVGGLRLSEYADITNKYGYDKLKTILREHKDTFDPYNLDTNNDASPCLRYFKK